MEIFNPPTPPSIGSIVPSGTENSVLFVGAGGVLSQDNANFNRTAAQFKYKTVTEHVTNGAFLFEFAGVNGGYTNGLVLRATDITGYFPNHIAMFNSGYATSGYIRVTNHNGIGFVSITPAKWEFSVQSISGGAMSAWINGSTSAVANEGVFNVNLGYAGQVGLRLQLAATPTADVIQIFANDGTTKLWSVGASGYIEHVEQTAPAAPAANGVRIYAVDNGAGKTQLMALFSSGAAQQLAIQP